MKDYPNKSMDGINIEGTKTGRWSGKTKECYQCEEKVDYLFDDSRCKDCTRLTPEEVRGERHE